MKRLIWIPGIVLVLAMGWTWGASAQQPTPSDDEVNAIAHQLYCPVCQNVPLDVCPTEACRQWRDLIRQMLSEGKSADAIRQYFVDNFGWRVLPEPPAQGFDWLIYVLPPFAFLAGAFLLFLAFRTWRRAAKSVELSAPAENSSASSAADREYAARLEEELRKRR